MKMTSDGATSTTSATARRKPSWKERENNRRRERRRRAVAAKIYSGLRTRGNYDLPKHCDNNEVLKALCAEAGWVVEEDGTTYRKGCELMQRDLLRNCTTAKIFSTPVPSPLSSLFPSPIASSCQGSPYSSSFPSPSRAHNNGTYNGIPLVRNNISVSLPPLRISSSAPITPLLSSPTMRNPNLVSHLGHSQFSAASAPASPTHLQLGARATNFVGDESETSTTESGHWVNINIQNQPSAPPAAIPINILSGQNGSNVEFDFRNGRVRPWEGERIHDAGLDDLELTLGTWKRRG